MKTFTLSLFCLFFYFAAHAQSDVAGSEDHPLISRYPGSRIDWYDAQDFDQYHVAIGKYHGYQAIDKWIDLEGKVTRIYYVIKGSQNLNDVYQNYRNSFQRAGLQSLTQGMFTKRNVDKGVGGASYLTAAFKKNPLPPIGKINLFHGTSTTGGSCYYAGKLARGDRDVHIVMAGRQYTSDEIVILLDIVESKPLDDNKVKVDPDYLAAQLATFGKVALYGIYFDFDKSTVKPESADALRAIADYLKQNPGVKLYVVGHTDMKGTLPYNIGLSEARAKATVNALVGDYGIATSRLIAKGVGPLCPVLTNQTDPGRAKNRRVELVLR